MRLKTNFLKLCSLFIFFLLSSCIDQSQNQDETETQNNKPAQISSLNLPINNTTTPTHSSTLLTTSSIETIDSAVFVFKVTEPNEEIDLPLILENHPFYIHYPVYTGNPNSILQYDFQVDWGDGSSIQSVTNTNHSHKKHTYELPGEYTVVISGLLEGWSYMQFDPPQEVIINGMPFSVPSIPHFRGADKLIKVLRFGNLGWKLLPSAFHACKNLTLFHGGNTQLVYEMGKMFSEAISLHDLDISTWDTTNVISMQGMFQDARSLESLNLSHFNVSNVKYMQNMFSMHPGTQLQVGLEVVPSSEPKLETLNLSNWNTSQVMDFSGMFQGLTKVQSLDLSSFQTQHATTFKNMFANMINLNSLNISGPGWDTSLVQDMSGMFINTHGLANLNLSHFNPSSVTTMNGMFQITLSQHPYDSNISISPSLSSLDLSSWTATSSLNNMSFMFAKNTALTTVNLANFNTSSVTNITHLFFESSSLNTIHAQNWDLSSVNVSGELMTDVNATVYCDESLTQGRLGACSTL